MFEFFEGIVIDSFLCPSKFLEQGRVLEIKVNSAPKAQNLLSRFPSNIQSAIEGSKKRFKFSKIPGGETFDIIVYDNHGGATRVYRIFYWGLICRDTSELYGNIIGHWKAMWGIPLLCYSGSRSHFFSDCDGLSLNDLEIIRLVTSKPEKPLLLNEADITPKDVVLADSEGQKDVFYATNLKEEFLKLTGKERIK
ncbi:MAG: hypothetical protein V1819_02195 [bacterium]